MDRCSSTEESRRDVVQRRTTCSNWGNGTQKNIHTKSPRCTSIRTPGDQQNISTCKPKILVAEHEARRDKLRTWMRGMPKTQNQHATHKSPTISDIPYTQSYAIRNC